jgi:hypothetical protein
MNFYVKYLKIAEVKQVGMNMYQHIVCLTAGKEPPPK